MFLPGAFSRQTDQRRRSIVFGGNAGFPRLFQGKLGVCAEGEEFFTALKVIFDAPAFVPRVEIKRKSPLPSKSFLRLVEWFGRTNGGIGKRHRGYSPGKGFPYPLKYPIK